MPTVIIRSWALYLMLGAIVVLVALLGMVSLAWKVATAEAQIQKSRVASCEAKYEVFVAKTTAEGLRAAEESRIKDIHHNLIVKETADGWKAALDHVRSDAARRVRDAARAGGSAVPDVSDSRQVADEPGANPIPAPEQLAADCAETTLTANSLQEFIERIAAINQPGHEGE